MCKAIAMYFVLSPVTMTLAQGLLYSQQTICQPFTAAPQGQWEVLGGETEYYPVPVQPELQGQWGTFPGCASGICCPTQQSTSFGQSFVVCPRELLNCRPFPVIPPTIDDTAHRAPQIERRPV